MRNFVAYLMRTRWHAALMATAFALLSLLLPIFSQVSGAVVGLVTLRLGSIAGLYVIAVAAACTTAIGLVAQAASNITAAFFAVILFATWLPAWLLAGVLRQTRALSAALAVATLLGVLVVVAIHLMLGNASQWWHEILSQAFRPVLEQTGATINSAQIDRIITLMAEAMTGLLGAACVFTGMTSLFIARWWQAILYNPGGFRKEVHGLHIDWRLSAVAAAVMLLAWLVSSGSSGFASDMLVVILALYMFPGLAIIHWIVSVTASNVAWLVVLYGLLLFLPSQAMVVLAALGFTDSWMDLRSRLNLKRRVR